MKDDSVSSSQFLFTRNMRAMVKIACSVKEAKARVVCSLVSYWWPSINADVEF